MLWALCGLNEVPARESGSGWFSPKLSSVLGCPGEAAKLISTAPGTSSASQLPQPREAAGRPRGEAVFELLPGQQLNTDFR